MDDRNYREYKKVKAQLNLYQDNIEYCQVLAEDILRVIYTNERITWKEVVRGFFKTTNLRLIKCEHPILFTDALKRQDHLELLSLIMSEFDNANHIRICNLKQKTVFCFSTIISSLLFTIGRTNRSFKERLFFASRLTYYRNLRKELTFWYRKEQPKIMTYVAFLSSYGIESLYTQFFKSINVETYSLSHGISYVNYKKTIALDIVNGENITANKILVWGESSKTDLMVNFKIDKDRVLVAGNPKYPHKKISIKQSFKSGMILLGGAIYEMGNQEILKMASQLQKKEDINFSAKIHPSLSKEYYELVCKNLNIALVDSTSNINDVFASGKYDFAIVNNSTTYYESMYYNMICFRYAPDENMEFLGLEDRFENESELKEKISFFAGAEKELLDTKIEQLLGSTLGMGINRYKEILDNRGL